MTLRAVLLLALLPLAPLSAAAPRNQIAVPDGPEVVFMNEDGTAYVVRYTAEGMMYRFADDTVPGRWWGPVPYHRLPGARRQVC